MSKDRTLTPIAAAVVTMVYRLGIKAIEYASQMHGPPAGQQLHFTVLGTEDRHLLPNAGVCPGTLVWYEGFTYAIADACQAIVYSETFCEDLFGPVRSEDVQRTQELMEGRPKETLFRDYRWLAEPSGDGWDGLGFYPNQSPRYRLAFLLFHQCVHWVIYHEVGHLLLQHHLWRQESSGSLQLLEANERPNDGRPTQTTHMHYAEIEADMHALMRCLSDMARGQQMFDELFAPVGLSATQSQALFHRVMRLVPIMIPMLLAAGGPGSLTTASKNHPSPAARFHLAQQVFRTVVADGVALEHDDNSLRDCGIALNVLYPYDHDISVIEPEAKALALEGARVEEKYGSYLDRIISHENSYRST